MSIIDDYGAIRNRAEALKKGIAAEYDYMDREAKRGPYASCAHCGRTTEQPADSPCTGKCGLPPGGRAGQSPVFDCG